jgi:hypothetical protein
MLGPWSILIDIQHHLTCIFSHVQIAINVRPSSPGPGMRPYWNRQLYMYFKASIIQVHQILVLHRSCVPEYVGVNKRRYSCKKERKG